MRLTIFFEEPEAQGLMTLSQRELRAPRDQVVLIVRNELVRLGLLSDQSDDDRLAGHEVDNGQ